MKNSQKISHCILGVMFLLHSVFQALLYMYLLSVHIINVN